MDKYDATKLHPLPAGSAFRDGRMPHFSGTKGEEVILQVEGRTASDINYVNLADDPRKKLCEAGDSGLVIDSTGKC